MTWRDIARPIISEVLYATKDQPEADIRKALFDAYPFGQRRYHPYKVWLDEIKKQRRAGEPVHPDFNRGLLDGLEATS